MTTNGDEDNGLAVNDTADGEGSSGVSRTVSVARWDRVVTVVDNGGVVAGRVDDSTRRVIDIGRSG